MSDPILAAIRRNVLELLPDVEPELVTEDRSLTDLGCNSIDRAEVVSMTMEDLGVSVPVREFADVHDIGALAAVLRKHAP
ncbi:phosphopantetheine-binding protein [Sphaerimonospora sp. CA-214678]|uniref:phosphopantetheine-binding protein n=1 Tax=Sphaerimonospora sp. CA-214678 TaxID=3240029 RepID=UPI003D91F295